MKPEAPRSPSQSPAIGDGLALRGEAERVAASLPPLMVEAERVASTVTQGVHGRRRVGVGESFWQFRRYADGDRMSSIDWRRSARTQHLYVRETEWEAAQSVWVWRDDSASMSYGSGHIQKRDRAAVLALALGILLVNAGERVAAPELPFPPQTGRLPLRRLAAHYAKSPSADTPSLPPEADIPRHAHCVWISDFLIEPDKVIEAVRAYARHGVKGHLIQVLDPAEETFPFHGRVWFSTQETHNELMVGRAEKLATDYRKRLLAHQTQLGLMARRLGWTFSVHLTDQSCASALLALYAATLDNKAGQ